jgi:general secretion pathway protein N
MTVRKYAIQILVLALPLCAGASASTAITDSLLDDQTDGARANGSVPSTWSEPTASVVEVTIPPAAPRTAIEHPLSANPLWAMPVKQFAATRDRPIFLPSRRPPALPASAVTVAKAIVPPKPKEPEQPQLSLVGTIASNDDKIGIFVDQATRAVLRLRVGEEFQGWQLQSVRSREVAFQRNQQSFVVALPQPGLSQPSVVVREVPAIVPDTRLLPANVRRPGRQ